MFNLETSPLYSCTTCAIFSMRRASKLSPCLFTKCPTQTKHSIFCEIFLYTGTLQLANSIREISRSSVISTCMWRFDWVLFLSSFPGTFPFFHQNYKTKEIIEDLLLTIISSFIICCCLLHEGFKGKVGNIYKELTTMPDKSMFYIYIFIIILLNINTSHF